ncbi:MAG: SprT-like domain-containing protein [Fibrobacterota bacterium]|nr:SprT-like domain-containing protein [Fibrobacterota bacterium]QQS04170.1 MAG: SprT-like domain-containing protein [Fibrobacterota bacterium]
MNALGRVIQGVLDLFGSDPQPRVILPRATAPRSAPPVGQSVARELSSRRKRGWSLVRKEGRWVCLVPSALMGAPPDIQQQLDEWIRAVLHPSPGSRARKQQSQKVIFAWMEPRTLEKVPVARPEGHAWDLQVLFDGLNQAYFEGRLEAVLRWSPKWGGLSTHQSLRTQHGHVHLITIARAYDATDVPKFAVEGVLYHEMCHIACPPRAGTGEKRVIHHREFREAERKYEHWTLWRDWERKNLRRRVKRGHHLLTGHK